MNTTQLTLKESLISEELFLQSPGRIHYLWENLVVEKRVPDNWLQKAYRGSVWQAFWSVLSSPLS